MQNKAGEAIYVGKAKDLKKRVSHYFNRRGAETGKNRAMIAQIHAVQSTVTRTEKEALILENHLIKDLKPRYNILFRDDKDYPYIYVSLEHPFPRFCYHRGRRDKKGKYIGPFPGAGAVKRTLRLIERLFLLRACEDNVFIHRSRPCLQYQIGRCSAPCVGYIDQQAYRQDVEYAMMFLAGKNEQVIKALTGPMQRAASALDFELAARYRDQISNLRDVQEKQYISSQGGEFDIIACAGTLGQFCVEVMCIRHGLNLGSKTYFPRQGQISDTAQALTAFLSQRYMERDHDGYGIPKEILTSEALVDGRLLETVLSEKAGHRVQIKYRLRGKRAKWLDMARHNAALSLQQRFSQAAYYTQRLQDLQARLALPALPSRIEGVDVSHTQGEATVASCVVFDRHGPLPREYRRFNIVGLSPGDDYAAIHQVVRRRYARIVQETSKLPDLILIDGGMGQVNAAKTALHQLHLGHIPLIGVAKGPTRRAGMETLILSTPLEGDNRSLSLGQDALALYLVQQIRDEAHRFAIQAHRKRRAYRRKTSLLESVPGIGARRRKALLEYFGGMQGIARAGIEDLVLVAGINQQLAGRIYELFHGDNL